MIVIGIDPGARWTGVSVRNLAEDTILLSSTYVRPDTQPLFTWSRDLATLIQTEVIDQFPGAIIGIEGVTEPKGFKGGKKAPLNPKHIINTALVAGFLAAALPIHVVVYPKNNGGRNANYYPDVLSGRRPKDLPGTGKGAGTRNHEKSAYDVAGATRSYYRDGYVLDVKKSDQD